MEVGDFPENHPVIATAMILAVASMSTYLIYALIPIGILNLPVCGFAASPTTGVYIFLAPNTPSVEGPLMPQPTQLSNGRYLWVSAQTYSTGQAVYFATAATPANLQRFYVLGSLPGATQSFACFNVGLVTAA